jgi:alkaline phosphatase D
LYEYVWAIGEDDQRDSRPGVYGAWTFGEPGSRVQVIMLDTRFFRSPLMPTDEYGAPGKERYLPDPDPSKTMLGEAQWAWLEGVLKEPADLRLLVSSIQVLSEGHGWEAWRTLPAERDKLYALIDETDAKGVIVLSGDRHSAALYRKEDVIDYPLFEATSSSLNLPVRGFLQPDQEFVNETDPNRMGDMYIDANYGLLEIDWETGTVTTTIRSETGEIVRNDVVTIDSLQ